MENTIKEMKGKLLYIAHPYTSTVKGEVINFNKVNAICNDLLDLGYTLISPISMNHPLHILKNRTHTYWIKFDLELLKKCDVLVLCGAYRKSVGCCMEYEHAKRIGMEVVEVEALLDG